MVHGGEVQTDRTHDRTQALYGPLQGPGQHNT